MGLLLREITGREGKRWGRIRKEGGRGRKMSIGYPM